jgi:hypothetical protein
MGKILFILLSRQKRKSIEPGNREVRETPAENLTEVAMNKAVFPAPHRRRWTAFQNLQ